MGVKMSTEIGLIISNSVLFLVGIFLFVNSYKLKKIYDSHHNLYRKYHDFLDELTKRFEKLPPKGKHHWE